MRFINLKKKLRYTTFYDRILSLGCGPNFVLNRLGEFKIMIKEQGVKFWFRFWLTFCFQPEIIEDPMCVNSHTYEVMNILCQIIHKQFLEGSPNDSLNYCCTIFTTVMIGQKKAELKNANGSENSSIKVKSTYQEFLQYNFGCALCEVFYVWLEAKFASTKGNYWIIPDTYLQADFRPRFLECYITEIWGMRILGLLGVNREIIPWIKPLLIDKQKQLNCPNATEQLERKAAVNDSFVPDPTMWQTKLNLMQITLVKVDESKNADNSAGDAHCSKELELEDNTVLVLIYFERPIGTLMLSWKDEVKETASQPKIITPRCSFCFNTENFVTKLKKCSLCVDSNCEDPKYYCGISCQTEDWFRNHAKEHFKVSPYSQLKPLMIEVSTANEGKMFTSSLFEA